MGTTEWGPAAWKFLHTATFAYGNAEGIVTDEDKHAARSLFESLRFMLPCKNCCSHYCDALEKRPLSEHVLRSKDSLSRWFVEIHNDVNERLGKPIFKYEDAKQLYESLAGCDVSATESCGVPLPMNTVGSRNDRTLLVISIGILGLLVGFFLGRLRR